jgi:hypothetical protein
VLEVHRRCVLVVNVLDHEIKGRRKVSCQRETFVELLSCCNIVFLLEVELNVHEHFKQFFHVNFKPLVILDNFEILDSQVNVRKRIILSVVKISQLDPLVDQTQW